MSLVLTLSPTATADRGLPQQQQQGEQGQLVPLCSHMIVQKAVLSPKRQPAASKSTLSSLLARRRIRLWEKRHSSTPREVSDQEPVMCVEGCNAIKRSPLSFEKRKDESSSLFHLASSFSSFSSSSSSSPPPLSSQLDRELLTDSSWGKAYCARNNTLTPVMATPTERRDGGGANEVAEEECERLAQRVVSQAKVRLLMKRRRKKLLKKAYNGDSKPKATCSKNNTTTATRSPVKSLTPLSKNSTPPRPPPLMKASPPRSNLPTPPQKPSPLLLSRQSKFGSMLCEDSPQAEDSSIRRCRRVLFLSERQSVTPKATGIPNVPPVTPCETYRQDVRVVPSMSDIKSQRELNNRLRTLNIKQEDDSIEKELQAKMEEARKKKLATAKLKAKQRAEIYALNKVMAQLEMEKFEAFMSGKV